MRRVEASEILDIAQYERQRTAYRSRIIELKKRRRVAVGPSITFVFENRDTVRSQVQEMMRAERIVDDRAIQHELDTYNSLLPGDSEIAATMLIELQDATRIRQQMAEFYGVNSAEATFLEIGESRSPGIFAAGQSDHERISAVQFVRFRMTDEQRESFLGPTDRVWLVIDHVNYRHRVQLVGAVRDELKQDLEAY